MTNRHRASSEWARGAGPAVSKHHKFPQLCCFSFGQMDESLAFPMLLDLACIGALRSYIVSSPTRANSMAAWPQGVFS